VSRVLTDPRVRALRARSQRLDAPRRSGTVEDVVADVFALQAQDDLAATLGIWVRSAGLTEADVARARNEDRSIVRLWCLRGTLHLVAAQDVRWLLDLLRPTLVRANSARRLELGLGEDMTARGVKALVALLAHGPLTRSAIAEGFAERGIPWQGQATIHVVWRAAVDGLVCCGPPQRGQPTFVLLDDWLAPTPPAAMVRDRDAMLAELARRFLRAYGPARPDDLAVWSGLAIGDARRGWAQLGPDVVEVQTERGPMWLPAGDGPVRHGDVLSASPPRDPTLVRERSGQAATTTEPSAVRLLPAFDGWWLGYRDRDLLLPPVYRQRVYPGGGLIRPSVLVDTQPVGTWTRKTSRQGIDVLVSPFDPLSATVLDSLRAEVDDLGRFLGRPAHLVT
jgi:hypothetical protein